MDERLGQGKLKPAPASDVPVELVGQDDRGGAQELVLDGRMLEGEWIELADDGARHSVVVTTLSP